MKYALPSKFIFAVGALCAAASSYAQSTGTSVTLYGILDEYGTVGRSSVGTTYKLESGGESGSRLGFRGSEDLGGGTRAIFTLESGFGADTGTTTNGTMWGRQSFVGLSNNQFGTVTLGRQQNLNYNEFEKISPFGVGLGGMYASGIFSTVGGSRVDNSVVYASPVFGGLQATVLGGLGEGTTGRTAAGDLSYNSGPIAVSGVYVHKNAFGAAQTAASSGLISASYDFGPVKLIGQAQEAKNVTQLLGTNDDRVEYAIGAQVPMGPHVLTAMLGTGRTKDVSDSRSSQLSVGYQYVMSKRTDLYAVASAIRNDSNVSYTTNSETGTGPINAAGHSVQSVSFGIRHRF